MWNCVEDRFTYQGNSYLGNNEKELGRVGRKIIFNDIFPDKFAAISNNPIPAHARRHLKVITTFIREEIERNG